MKKPAERISRSCRTIVVHDGGSCTPPSKTRQTASSQPPHGGSQSVSSSRPASTVSPSSSSTSRATASCGDSLDLDHAAGQVEVALVGQLAQQHPAVGGADQHLADRALARQEGVQQRAEALGVLQRGVVDQPGVDDPVGLLGDAARDALAHQPGEGGHPLGRLVVGVDVGLDAGRPALERRLDERGAPRRPTSRSPCSCSSGDQETRTTPGATGSQLGRHVLSPR